ncbi:HAD hydrolase-like protein [Candidatus Pacearchaeota archaeon]|nr:HAD hydrolase-like protein [Candidatus Pacearchaeota archaeon]
MVCVRLLDAQDAHPCTEVRGFAKHLDITLFMIKGIIFDWVGTLYERDRGLFPFTKKVLENLKPRYKLALISQTAETTSEKRWKEIEPIARYFEIILVESEKTREQYLNCIDNLGLRPEEVVVVDDRASRGIAIANKAGCKTCWIQKGDRSYDSPSKETGEPTHSIDSIEGLLKLL